VISLAGSNFNHYSKTAKSAINRFYDHADTRTINKLQELVSDLAVAEATTQDKLWKSAQAALAKTNAPPARVVAVVEERDLKAFALLVAGIASGKFSA